MTNPSITMDPSIISPFPVAISSLEFADISSSTFTSDTKRRSNPHSLSFKHGHGSLPWSVVSPSITLPHLPRSCYMSSFPPASLLCFRTYGAWSWPGLGVISVSAPNSGWKLRGPTYLSTPQFYRLFKTRTPPYTTLNSRRLASEPRSTSSSWFAHLGT